MKATFLKGVALGAAVSSVTLVASAAFAGTGIGAVFNLGKTNAVNAPTQLRGSVNTGQLQVVNTNTGGLATGIGIAVPSNRPPLVVTSKAKVGNLNADLLDGVDSSQLALAGGSTGYIVDDVASGLAAATCPSGTKLTGGGGYAAGADNVLILSGPDPSTARTWDAAATPSTEEVFALAICYNPRGKVPGAVSLQAMRALQRHVLRRKSG